MGLKDLVVDGLTAIRQRLPSFDVTRDNSERETHPDAGSEEEETGRPFVCVAAASTIAFPSMKVKRRVQESSAEGSGGHNEDPLSDVSVPKDSTIDECQPKSSAGGQWKKEKKQKRNELTHLIPGYTAPISLSSSSLDMYRLPGGLEAIRKQSLAADHPAQPTSTAAGFSGKRKRKDTSHAGDGWFQMRPTPLTDEVKKDLQFIRNRNYLDPKRFYKSSDPTGQFVQIGTVIEGPSEFFSSRLTKKERRTNLVDEVLADTSSSQYAQNKFQQLQREKTALAQKRKRFFGKKRR